MKFQTLFIVLLILVFILSPIAAIDWDQNTQTPKTSPSVSEQNTATNPDQDGTVTVLRQGSGDIARMDTAEYLIGVLAAEMPAAYHVEALKAQTVACYTYLQRQKQQQANKPDDALQGADITDSSQSHQGYLNESQRKEKWGKQFDSNEKKMSDAIDAVMGTLLLYEKEPILAAFHAISPGQTESAKVVWGKDVPYLKSILSAGDKLSPQFGQTVVFSEAQFQEKAKTLPDITLQDNAADWLGKAETSDVGTVTSIAIGKKPYTGTQVREAFGLPSAVFTVSYSESGFRFETKGYGHAVGMSQYGADYMARQGSTYEQILQHYYPGTTLSKAEK